MAYLIGIKHSVCSLIWQWFSKWFLWKDLLFVVLCPRNVSGHIRMGTDSWQCALMATLQSCPTGKENPPASWLDIPLSHYPDTEPTSPYHILIMPSTWLRSDKYQFKSHWFDSTMVQTRKVRIPWSPKMGDRCSTHSAISSGPLWKDVWIRFGIR